MTLNQQMKEISKCNTPMIRLDIFKLYFANVIIPYCIYIMFYHIFIEYLELPK